jgi:hypothetical protein
MIPVIRHWAPEVQNIVNQLNKAINDKNSDLARGMILELMKFLNPNQNQNVRTSAAWAFSEISEKYGKSIKNAIPTLVSLLSEEDSFLVNYTINTLDNLVTIFPEEVVEVIPDVLKALDNIDPGVRKACLSFLNKVASNFPEEINKNLSIIREIKITSRDLDRSIASMAREVLETLIFFSIKITPFNQILNCSIDIKIMIIFVSLCNKRGN